MILKNGKEIIEINKGVNAFIEIYMGKRLMWELVRSCFGKGYWNNNLPWINDDIWRNN